MTTPGTDPTVTGAPARITLVMPSGTTARLHDGDPVNVFISGGWAHAEQDGYWHSYPAERILSIEWIKAEEPSS